MLNKKLQGLLSVHIAVALFGVAGVFAKLLTIEPALIVFGRTFFACVALLVVLPLVKGDMRLKEGKDALGFLLMGTILALHWVTFFHSIQISTVAIGLLTFSTFPIFVTFFEPLFFKERLRVIDIFVCLVVFLGLILVIPDLDFQNNLTIGAFWGVFSGLTFAFLSILNRTFVSNYPAMTIAFYQNMIASLVLLPVVGGTVLTTTAHELRLLVLLGVVFTALAHSFFIRGLLHVKAQLASVIASLEPVYGIVLAMVLLKEIPTVRECIGGCIIVGAIVFATRFGGKKAERKKELDVFSR